MDDFSDGRYKIILFNGPPRAGKDTAVSLLNEVPNLPEIKREKFAAPLKAAVKAFYGLTNDEWAFFDSPDNKDKPHPVFCGKTCREAQIAMSEVYAKPFHQSKTVFGELLVRRMISWHVGGLFGISDSGFIEEAYPLISTFGKGNVMLVRIYREGHTYAIDSRNYLYDDSLTSIDVSNSGDLEQYRKTLLNATGDFIRSYGG